MPKPPEETGGFQLGSFLFVPEISLARIYNDNIFAERKNEKKDWITVISPAALLRSTWSEHKLEFWGGLDADIYDHNASENVIDHWLEARGRYDFSPSTNVYGGLGVSKNHEDRSYPTRQYTNAEPTRFWETKGHAGIFHKFTDNATLRFGLTQERLDYLDAPSTTGGTVNMDDRDRTHTAVGGRAMFTVSEQFEPFIQGSKETRNYKVAHDDNGYRRDSSGYRAAAGFKFNIEPYVYGELYGGVLHQNYDDSRLSDVTAPDMGATMTWLVNRDTRLKFNLDRYLEESTLPGVSASLDTVASTRLEYRYRHDVTFSARYAYTYSDFKGNDLSDPTRPYHRQDHAYETGFGVKYDINKHLYWAFDYDFRRRSSNFWDDSVANPLDRIAGNYVGNRLMLSIGTQWLPKERWETLSSGEGSFFGSQDASLSGFYLGGLLGIGAVQTELTGPRGSSEISNDFAALSPSAGLFLGYGVTFDPWYLGIEADVNQGGKAWKHETTPTDRNFSAKKKEGWGLSLLGGYQVENGSLIYARLGKVWTTFQSGYQQVDETTSAVVFDETRDFHVTGDRLGVGTDIPLGDRFFARIDYSHILYDHYYQNLDRFRNSEDVFSLGIGYRPGGKAASKVTAVDYRGFYVGAGIGNGVLETSRVASQQNSGGGLPSVELSSDQGASALVYGINAGAGYTFKDRWYVGVQIAAEPGLIDWEQQRDSNSNSRRLLVERKSSYGVSARLGYVLPNGTLLYGRFGTESGDFNVKYVKGNSQSTWLDYDIRRWATTYGLGAEVPLSTTTYLAFDWGRSDYEKISFVTAQGASDKVSLDNTLSSFKLGVGFRF